MNISTENYVLLTFFFTLVFITFNNSDNSDNFGNCKENNKLAQIEIDKYNNRSFNIDGTNKFYDTMFLPQKPTCCKKYLGHPVTDNDRLSCNCPDNK
jgi:hypothetical protein